MASVTIGEDSQQSPLKGFASGAGYAAGQGAVNLAMTPVNVALSSWQMDKQANIQKDLTEHNAEVTNRLQRERNLQNFSELAQGAEKAGFSPLAALGGDFSSASAASAPMPSATTPQVQPPSILEASQARLLQAQAKKVENENEDTSGERRTLQENLPAFFRDVAKKSNDEDLKKNLQDIADDVEANGTTRGAFEGYLKSIFEAPKESMRTLRDISDNKKQFMINEAQIHDKAVLEALRKLPVVERQQMLANISKLSSDIALNGAKITLSTAQMQELLASAKKLAAEWSKITNNDYNTAIAEGRIWDFVNMMAGNLINSAVGNVGEVGAAVVTKKPPRRATKRLIGKLERGKRQTDYALSSFR